jgi:hypothetical protein
MNVDREAIRMAETIAFGGHGISAEAYGTQVS